MEQKRVYLKTIMVKQSFMKTANQLNKHFFIAVLCIVFGACQEQAKQTETITVSGVIAEDVTWYAANNYILDQQVTVADGATLTIEPGTVIKANPGEAPTVSMLVVARGGKLMAKGTEEKPIVFTSINDNYDPKQNVASALSDSDLGLWGGIILLGKAPIELPSGDAETFYVGLDPNNTSSYYGGNDSKDSSGVMEYVSVRHGGIFIGTGSESNGITFCGVGAGTSIKNIEIFANQDDGIEFFGGNVTVDNVLIHASGDDAIDIDEGFAGVVQNFIVELTENSDSAIEINGIDEDSDRTFRLNNGRIKGTSQSLFNIDNKAKGSIANLTLVNKDETEGSNPSTQYVNIQIVEKNEPALDAFKWARANRK